MPADLAAVRRAGAAGVGGLLALYRGGRIDENLRALAEAWARGRTRHPIMNPYPLVIAGVEFSSRIFLGTGKFSSGEVMRASLEASGTQLVTVALGRVRTGGEPDDILDHLDTGRYRLLPNTSGTRNAREAVLAAELAREALGTNWLKLEIHPDPKYLMPDPIETLAATELLAKRGFVVLPYVHADPVLCKRLEEAGAAAVMPLGAPIGSNLGLESRAFLEIIIAQSRVPVVVDAGLGAPSHAAAALEMGADAVLVNTAIAAAADPVGMARRVPARGRGGEARQGGGPRSRGVRRGTVEASATSPLTSFLGGPHDMNFTDTWRRHDFGEVARRVASRTPADVRRALGRPADPWTSRILRRSSPPPRRPSWRTWPRPPTMHRGALRQDDAPLRAALPLQRLRQRVHLLRVQRPQQDPPEGALRPRDPRRGQGPEGPRIRERAPGYRRGRGGSGPTISPIP